MILACSFNENELKVRVQKISADNMHTQIVSKDQRVAVFGWKQDTQRALIDKCRALARALAAAGFQVVTGGGGGFMSAANEGAADVDPTRSAGVGVAFLGSEPPNAHITPANYYQTYDFYSRKMMLLTTARHLVFFPGGIGTLDEWTEIVNLTKCDPRLDRVEIYLVGATFWHGLRAVFEAHGTNFPAARYVGDDIDAVVKLITQSGP